MPISVTYLLYKEIRFEIIMAIAQIEGQSRKADPCRRSVRPVQSETRKGELQMREWQKPTIDETESGMEVTSYLPAELDRA
jgi:coenzyme PQQ precursor peptide PqqA